MVLVIRVSYSYKLYDTNGEKLMIALVRFLFTFFFGWICAVWIYDVSFPVKRLPELIHNKAEDFKNAEFLGMRVFEKIEDTTKDISLPDQLKPLFEKPEDTQDMPLSDKPEP